jgi:hypothetical protein
MSIIYAYLSLIPHDNGNISLGLRFWFSFAFGFGLFTLITIVLYMWNIINFPSPNTIIQSLVNDIDEENVSSEDVDPFQPIFDIIHRAILKYDIETTGIALTTINNKIIEIISESTRKEQSADCFTIFSSIRKIL